MNGCSGPSRHRSIHWATSADPASSARPRFEDPSEFFKSCKAAKDASNSHTDPVGHQPASLPALAGPSAAPVSDSGIWHLYFEAEVPTDEVNPACDKGTRLGHATSTEGVTWTWSPAAVLEPVVGTGWGSSTAHPSVLYARRLPPPVLRQQRRARHRGRQQRPGRRGLRDLHRRPELQGRGTARRQPGRRGRGPPWAPTGSRRPRAPETWSRSRRSPSTRGGPTGGCCTATPAGWSTTPRMPTTAARPSAWRPRTWPSPRPQARSAPDPERPRRPCARVSSALWEDRCSGRSRPAWPVPTPPGWAATRRRPGRSPLSARTRR
jgi:hypothetical protein